jgi:hypothetical protein
MIEKIINNIEVYATHEKGSDLLNIDLWDLIDEKTEPLHERIAILNTRIEYLEMRENDLIGENAVLRTKIIEKENSTNSSNSN